MRGGILDTIKMQCLQVNISDQNSYATNGFDSASFSSGRVCNRGTKVFIYSCNTPHFTMRRTQAQKPHFNCRKGLMVDWLGLIPITSTSIIGFQQSMTQTTLTANAKLLYVLLLVVIL